MKRIYLSLLLSLLAICGYAQTTYYYQGGTFTTASNWNTAADGSGSPASVFTGATDTWIVTTTNPLTANAAWTVAGALQIDGTCTISTNPTITGGITVNSGGSLIQNAASTAAAPNMAAVQNATSTIEYASNTTHTLPGITYGNLTISGTAANTAGAAITVAGTLTVNVGSTLAMSTFQLTDGGSFAASVSGTLTTANIGTTPIPAGQTWGGTVSYLSGSNQTVRGGTYNNLSIGSAGTRTYTADGALTINGNLNFALATTTLADGSFTVTLAGNITGAAGKHSGTGKILMTGAGATIVGSTNLGNIEFNNAAGFTLLGATTFNGTTTFTAGALTIGANTMTIATGGSVVGMSATNCLVGGATSNVTVSSTGNIGSLYFDQTTPGTTNTLATLTCSGNAGTTTIGNSLTITSLAYGAATTAVLADGGNTITVLGNITGGGRHSGTGKLLMTGAGATISNMSQSGNIELNNAAGFSLSGALSVNGTITFTNGKLNIGANTLNVATGGGFAGVTSTNCLVGGASSNVNVSSTGAVSLYLDQSTPGTSNFLGTLTCTGAAGTTTLGGDITVGTTLALSSATATLNDGGYIVTLQGDISGTGKHAGSGKIYMTGSNKNISGLANSGNIELDNSGNFNVTGSISCNGTWTFTSSTVTLGTVTFTILTNGSVSGMSSSKYFTTGASTNFTVNTTGSTGTIFFDQTTPGTTNAITTFTNTAGTTTLGNDLYVGTTLTLTAGTLDDNGNTITLAGNVSGTNGAHTGTGKILMTGASKTIGATVGGLGNVELNNASGFSLSANTIINGALTFTSGKLSILARTLTLKGTVASMSGTNCITGSATGSLTINTGGALGTLFFDQTTPGTSNNIATFTNTAGTTTLGNAVSMGALALTAGTLDDNGNVISLNGSITGAGTHTSGVGGKISLNAASKSISGVTLGNLDLNYAGATTLTGNPTISGALTFLSTAIFTISAGRTLTLNGTVVGMSATNYFGGSTTSDLTIGSTGALGTLYFGQTTTLNNIRNFVMNGGGSAVLASNMTSVTSMDLSTGSGGSLSLGANTLFLNGTFAGGAGTGYLTGGASSVLSITSASGYTLHLDQSTPGTSNNILTFTKAGAGTVTLGGDLSAGTLALSAGTLADGGNTITLSGNITGTGAHSGAGKIRMTGVAATISGAALGNLELDAAGAFSLSGGPTLSGSLTFTQGTLSLNGQTLTLNGALSGTSAARYFTGSAGTSNIAIGGSGALSTLYFDQSVDGTSNRLGTLTINRSGAVGVLGNKALVATTLALTSGQLSLNDQTLALGGTVTGSSSSNTLIGSASSNLTITGSGAVGTVYFDQTTDGTTNNISAFSLTRNTLAAGTFTMGNKMVIGTSCALTTSRIMMNGQTLELKGTFSGASGTAAISGTTTSNLIVSGSGAFGTLIMDQTTVNTTNALADFTMNRSGQTVTLGNALVSASDFTLTAGQVAIGGQTLTLNGTFTGSSTDNLIGSATSNLTIGATSALGTLYFDQSTPGTTNRIATFTTSGAGGNTTLGSDMSVATTLALTSATHTLSGNGFVISNNGNISGTGIYTSGTGGKITMTGLNKSISGATLDNVEFNYGSGASAFTLSGSPTINGALTFTGATNTLSIGAGNTLNLNGTVSGMSSTKYFTGSTTSNMVIGSTGALGTIFMNTSTAANRTLASLTLSNGGSVTMGSIATINTALALTNGTFADGGNIITVSGSITGTGTHTSTSGGKITMTGTTKNISGATLGNLELNVASTFSLTGSPIVTGAFTFTNGTLNVGANTLTLAGTVASMSATKYITGGATSNLNVTSTGALGTLFLDPTTPGTTNNFSTFTMNGSGGTATLGNALSAGTLALTAGTLAGSTMAISVTGNITGTGTHTSSGAGAISMTGSNATISGAALGNLTLNGSGFSLTGDPTISGTLTLTAGNLDLGSNNLTLAGAAAVAGSPAAGNMIVTSGSGELRKSYSANSAYSFPVGDNAGNYTPLALNVTSGTYGGGAYVGVRVTNAKHPQNANTNNYLNRYWTLNTSAITSPAYSLTATYVPADITGTESSISGAKYTGSLPWVKFNALSSNTLTTSSISNTSVAISGVAGVSPTVTASSDVTICNGGSANLTVAASTGTPTLTYSWAPATGLSATTGSSVTASPTTTTTYTLTLTDGNGETATDDVVVTVTPAPSASPANDGYICNGGTVNLTANPSGSTTTYAWSGSNLSATTVANPSATPTSTTIYTLTVTDGTANAGCSVDFTTTVNVHAIPTAGPTNNGYICNGGTVALTANPANGATAYTWSGSNLSASTSQNPTATPTSSTVYTLTVSDGTSQSGCAPATEYTTAVTVNTTPTAAPTGSSPICVGGTVNFTANPAGGATAYSWSGSNLSSATTQNPTATPTSTTVYTLTVSDGTSNPGCAPATQYTVSVTVDPVPTLTSASTGGIACAGYTLNLLANGPSNVTDYSWSGPNSFSSTDQNPSISSVTTAAAGTYTLTVNNGTGSNCSATYATTATVVNSPVAITGTLSTCEANSTTLANTTSGGSWLSSNSSVATVGSSTGIVTGVAAGNATITYKIGASGCYVTADVTVNVQPAAVTGTAVMCYGATTTLANAVSGGVWSSSNAAVAPIDASGVVTGTNPGTAIISYTMGSGTGCRSTRTVTVNALPLTISGTTAVCENKTTTLSDLTAGGTWSSSDLTVATVGSTSGVVSGVATGNANITYSNSTTGCYRFVTTTVNQSPTAFTGNAPVCVGSTITISNSISGGTWSASGGTGTIGSATGILTGVSAGTPVISYTLPNGCRVTANGTVNTTPGNFGGNFVVCAGSTINLSSTPSGGVWSSSDNSLATVGTSGTVTGVAGGNPVISYTLSTGCFNTKQITVNSIAPITGGGAGVCVGSTITLGEAVGGGAWSSSSASRATVDASGVATGIAAGATNISYTMPSGCKVWIALAVNPISAITGTAMACEGLTTTLADATAGGAWSSSDLSVATIGTTGIVTGGTAGVTTISYITPAGCLATKSVTINQAPVAISGGSTVCAGSVLTLSDAVTGGTWSSSSTSVATVGSTTGIVTGVAGGNVTITYSNGPGCAVTKALTVSPILPITGTNSACIGMTTTLSDASAGGNWSSSNTAVATIGTSGIVSGLSSGLTTVTYALPSGCARTITVSVNPVPTSITGTGTVCASLTTVLNGDNPGGTWVSSNTAIATVGSTTGVVTGVASGTANITYNMGLNCRISTVVTVNSSPAITGTAKACIGTSTTLSHSIPGGTWESSNTSVATIGSSDGIATGVTTGTTTITYTPPSGCLRTVVLTVNANPGANSGVMTVCEGSTTLITNSTPGGVSFTSSTPSVATIGATSGVVTGVSAGTTTITYNVNTGCYSTSVVTVNAVPASITGSSSVCVAATTTLGNATAGGTWTSSNVALATVGSSSGIVSGLSAGAPKITYTLSTGCYKVTTVTVLANTVNTGTASICVGANATLSNATTGGVWTSSDALTASVGSSSGILTGVAAGNADITYTNPAGCVRVSTATVNTSPANITGTQSVCIGFTTTLGNATAGGVWTSSTTNATIGSSTGIVSGILAGTTNISYTIGSCRATAQVTVNSQPAAITGATSVCEGFSTTLADATSGGTWSSAISSVISLGTSGIVTGLAAGNEAVTYTAPTGCYRSVNVIVNPTPGAISGLLQACPGTTTVLTSPTSGGVSFISSNTSVATVGATSGVVTGITAGTSSLTYTVNTGCYTIAEVTINPLPAAITGASDVCPGLTITLNDADAGGTWSSHYVVVGSTDGIVTGVGSGVREVTYTLPSGCSATTNVTVNPVADITGFTMLCVAAVETLNNSVASGTWTSSNTAVATIGSSSGTITALSGGTTTISYTTPAGCIVTREETVNAVVSSGTISGATTVVAGLQITLSDDISGGAWASSNTSVATVQSGDGIVTGVTPGNVVISYTVDNGCGPVTGTYSVSVTSSRAGGNVAVNNTAVDFTVFPNPNKGEFTIKGVLAESKDQDIYVEVANVLGQVIYHENMTAHNGMLEQRVMLGNTLSNGTYMLKLNLPGESKVFHFVINQ